MGLTDELTPVLKKLRLSGVLQSIDLRTSEAVDGELGYAESLYRLLQDEVERRDAKQLDLRLSRANFEHQKTVADFDFTFNKDMPKAKLIDLATCAFLRRRENLLLLGPAGAATSSAPTHFSSPAATGESPMLSTREVQPPSGPTATETPRTNPIRRTTAWKGSTR